MKVERTIKNPKNYNSYELRTVKVTFEGKTYKLNQVGEIGEPLKDCWRMSKTQFKNLLKAYPTLFLAKKQYDHKNAWGRATKKVQEEILENIHDYDLKIDYNMDKNIFEIFTSASIEGWFVAFEANVEPYHISELE